MIFVDLGKQTIKLEIKKFHLSFLILLTQKSIQFPQFSKYIKIFAAHACMSYEKKDF